MPVVVALFRYPLKSAAGERVEELRLTANGVVGDRAWAVTDADGTVVSAKHPTRGGPLLQVRSTYDDDTATTTVAVPGREPAAAGTAAADAALSDWLGRDVRLRSDASPDLELRRRWPDERGLVPEWDAAAAPGSEATTPMAGAALRGSFVDYGAVHVVTQEALDRLSSDVGRAVDVRRFRPNLLLSGVGMDPDPGSVLTVGGVRLRVEIPTPRCVVPGLAHDGGAVDADLLRALARQERQQVGRLGRAACFGFYVTVETDATIRAAAPVPGTPCHGG